MSIRTRAIGTLTGLTAALVGLTAVPAQAASVQTRALAFARDQLGKPYEWGATGPRAYDCSGLTRASYRAGGKRIPRTAQQQYDALRHIALNRVKPGDLVFFGRSARSITHAGVFAGYKNGVGYVINANTGRYRGRKVVDAPTREYRTGGLHEYGATP